MLIGASLLAEVVAQPIDGSATGCGPGPLPEGEADHRYGCNRESRRRRRMGPHLPTCTLSGLHTRLSRLSREVRGSVDKSSAGFRHRVAGILSNMSRHLAQAMNDILIYVPHFLGDASGYVVDHGFLLFWKRHSITRGAYPA